MTTRKVLITIIVLIAALAVAMPAWAGGWAVTTLDHLPERVIVNEPVTTGFVVRQHGKEAREGLTTSIRATHRETGETITVQGVEDSPAHYTATLTFPKEGTWDWWINGFGYEQRMPSLTVLPDANAMPRTGTSSPLRGIGTGLAAFGLIAGVIVWAQRPRWGIPMVALSLAMIAAVMSLPSESATAAASETPQVEAVSYGEALFIAKGCVVCHSNSRVSETPEFSVNMGPDLSAYTNSPEYLRTWLKDPAALKPATTMPNLGLKEVEIEALIVFINEAE